MPVPAAIDTSAKRSKLEPRKNPYWQGVSGGRGGVSLGYRRGARGPGSWIAKIVVDGQRIEERLGEADDPEAPVGSLGYRAAVAAALAWSKEQHAGIEARASAANRDLVTVRVAIEAYSKARKQRSERAGKNAEGRLKRYVLSDEALACLRLAKLRAADLDGWRGRLPESLSPSSVNRLLNDLRAALNAAAERHRRELPAHLPAEIRAGTKSASLATTARKQILSEAMVRRIVDAAFEVDEESDFARLVMLLAATGARHSQLAAAAVGAVQPEHARIMVPGSAKGRATRAKPPIAVPLAPDVLDRLSEVLEGRPDHEPLLMRWSYKNRGGARWEKDTRRAWGPADECQKLWTATIAKAGAPADTVMYALRHSSIVRGLRAGLPIRLVAALHDTSSEMIEAHYSAYIVEATQDLARRAVMSLAAAE